MKVLMLGWEFPPHNQGGLGTACEGLVNGLLHHNAEVTMVLPRQHSGTNSNCIFLSPSGKLLSVDSNLIAYQTPQSYNSEETLYGKTLFAEVQRYSKEVVSLVRNVDFDVIHVHDWMTAQAGMNIQEAFGKPLVMQVHATEFDRTGGNGLHKHVYEIEKRGMKKANKVIAVSNFTKRKIMQHYALPAEKITVVHNAVNFPHYDANLVKLPAKQSSVVLFLGRITLQKGPDYFIEAAKRVLEHGTEARFVIVGSGDMESSAMQRVASWGLADKILFTGFLRGADLEKMYKMADCYVMPSVSEPFGITPLEAMRNNVPVIISNQSGVSEVIYHCLKVDFWDIDEMASKIISVLHHQELKQELSNNGKMEVHKFNWNIPAKKCLDVYNSVVGGSAW